MKVFKYNQIICCSSEKSAITGMPGFGVRTKSHGLSDEEADDIYLKSGLRYALPVEKMVTAETLQQTPQLDTIYPHIYAFKQVQLSDGSVRYIIARVMYAGGDYGFFTDTGLNNRVGSNYIAHIFVFDEIPPMNLMAEILQQKRFLPVNTMCTSTNGEFTRILLGESFELPVGEIVISDSPRLTYNSIHCHLLIAMLQAHKNKLENSELCNIIAKMNTSSVTDTIIAMGAMPQQLTEDMFFNANMMEQSSVPPGMRLIIMNEKDDEETLDEYHIVIDARGDHVKLTNIQMNYLFEKIIELSAVGDVNHINSIAQLYLYLCDKPEPNYETAYQLVTLAISEDKLAITDIESLDFELIDHLSLSDNEKDTIWSKTNKVLEETFSYPYNLKEIPTALNIIARIQSVYPRKLEHTNEYAQVLNQILFGSNEDFAQVLENNQSLITIVLDLLKNATVELPCVDAFYKSLMTTSDAGVWSTFLNYYYKDKNTVTEHMPEIVNRLMASNHQELAKELFPIADNFNKWLQVINVCPNYSIFVKDEICDLLCAKLKESPQNVIDGVLCLNSEALLHLNMQHIADVYADAIMDSETINYNAVEATSHRLSLLGVTSNRLDTLSAIHSEKNLSNPTYKEIKFTFRQKASHSYILVLFETWIKHNASVEDITSFISEYAKDPSVAAELMDLVWFNTSTQQRESTLVSIVDHLRLNGYSQSDVIEKLKDEKAQVLLKKENKLFKKLLRKTLGIKFILMCGLIGMCLETSCGMSDNNDDTKYITPFRAEHFGDSVGVYKVSISEYNHRGTLLNIYSRGYSRSGKLSFTTSYNNKGDIDSIVYVYSSDGQLIAIRESGVEYTDFLYNDQHQLCQYSKTITKEKGKSICKKYSFVYNTDSTLREETVSCDDEIVVKKEFYYVDKKLKTVRETGQGLRHERNFNTADGTIESVYTYSYPKGRLQIARNFNYKDISLKNDTLYSQTIRITNSKGRNQGRLVKDIVTYNQLSINNNNQNVTALSTITNIADIEKSGISNNSSNFIKNYFENLKYRIQVNQAKTRSPGLWLLCIVLVLTCLCSFLYYRLASNYSLFQSFSGKPNKVGMKKLWMFNSGPYINVSLYLLIVLCAFITAVLLLLAFGAVTYGLLWLLKLLIIVLVWVGWISFVLGLVVLFGGKEGGGCLPVILGGLVIYFEDSLRGFGEDIVNWGFLFMKKVNIFDWGLSLFVDFWDTILLCYAIPMFAFIVISLAVIILISFLTCTEWGIMKLYGISRPCPVCGSKDEKEYWVDKMHKHPVKLQPGVYGVFSHTEPLTKTKMPTMLLFGKSKLLRKCNDCGYFITSVAGKSYGTEKHIGIVGHRSSGKSYLTYTILDRIMKKYGSSAYQIDVDTDTKIESNVSRIENDQGIQTDVRESYRAIQLIIKPKLRPIPYHLFFYDVAGEKFSHKSSASKTAMDFYTNVNQIIFIIDPTSIDFSFTTISDKMREWLKTNGSNEKYSVDGTFSTLISILETAGRNSKDINFMFVLMKADKGYLQHCGKKTNMNNNEIKQFLQFELGLTNVINAARGAFNKIEYEIASVKKEYSLQLNKIIDQVFNNLSI